MISSEKIRGKNKWQILYVCIYLSMRSIRSMRGGLFSASSWTHVAVHPSGCPLPAHKLIAFPHYKHATLTCARFPRTHDFPPILYFPAVFFPPISRHVYVWIDCTTRLKIMYIVTFRGRVSHIPMSVVTMHTVAVHICTIHAHTLREHTIRANERMIRANIFAPNNVRSSNQNVQETTLVKLWKYDVRVRVCPCWGVIAPN